VVFNFQPVSGNACSLNGIGNPNVSDVQMIINEAVGVAPPANDLNLDGAVNVTDVLIVVNAVRGGGCSGA